MSSERRRPVADIGARDAAMAYENHVAATSGFRDPKRTLGSKRIENGKIFRW